MRPASAQDFWFEVKMVFGEALECPPSQRTTFLLERCAASPEVLHEVHRLIQLEQMTDGFLSGPVELDREDASLPVLRPGDVVAGRYSVEDQIGQGGMCGGVYRVLDLEHGVPLALKVICGAQEFLAARHITHRNVCRVFDCGLDGEMRFLTMELLEGETLESRLHAAGGPLDRATEVRWLFRQICEGLMAAHEAGVLHRDLKPSNVLITSDGRVVLTDFGLAQMIGHEAATASTAGFGTLPYMAPEVLAGRPATAASDVYSLGVLLCEVVTGKLPCDGVRLPFRWRRLMQQCLAVDPSRRPSIGEVRDRVAGRFLW
jgi:serine/threonine protein kinase